MSETIERPNSERPSRTVRLFRNGRNQALRIPKEFEFATQDAVLRRVGSSLIVEPFIVNPPLGSVASLQLALTQITAMGACSDALPNLDDAHLPPSPNIVFE